MTLKFRAMALAGISGAVFDSAAFDTGAFDINSWDFGETVAAPLAGWSQDTSIIDEEDDLFCLTQAILIAMRRKHD